MGRGRSITVVDVDGDAAALGVFDARGDSVHVRAGCVETGGDALRAACERAGVRGGRCVMSVARRDVVLKLVALPGEGELSERERYDLVRLRVAGGEEDVAADWVLAEAGGTGRAAVAGVMASGQVRDRIEAVSACGLEARAALLRCMGAAALVDAESAGVVVIAPGARSTEIVVVSRGVPVLARSIDARASIGEETRDAIDGVAARIAIEAKRTVMNARTPGVGVEALGVVVLGEDALADSVRSACELELGLAVEEMGARVTWDASVAVGDRRALLPLAGLAIAHRSGRDAIDLLNPVKAPDTNARRRQAALAAAFVLISVAGIGYVGAKARLASLEDELHRVSDASADSYAQLVRFRAQGARVQHAGVWVDASTDWIERFAGVVENLPERSRAALAEISGGTEHDIEFAPGESVFPGEWTTRTRTTIRVKGSAGDRETMLEVRRAFIDDPAFHVVTRGADADASFELTLIADETRAGVAE